MKNVVVIASLTLMSSCAIETTENSEQHRTITTIEAPAFGRPDEEQLMEFSERFPEFAGWYCKDATLVVGVVGSGTEEEEEVRMAVVEAGIANGCYNRDFLLQIPTVQMEHKQYTFRELSTWRDQVWSKFFDLDEALGIGIGYRRNLLKFEVDSSEAILAIRHITNQHNIPNDAVSVSVIQRPQLDFACTIPSNGPLLDDGFGSNTYQKCFRPIPGGVEMSPTPGGECTITAATDRYLPSLGIWQSGLVVAGHCLTPTGALTGKYAYQHDFTDAAQFVGSEYVDPPFWPCVAGYSGSPMCRYSDSTWVIAGSSYSPVQHGTIAQTLFRGSGMPGSLQINPSHPRFYIWGKRSVVEGMQVEKVGRSTGWTTGEVTDTCTDRVTNEVFPDGKKHIYICQFLSTLHSTGGDSGAPVFYWWWFHYVDTVELVGLHWGRESTRGYHSSWTSVEADIGPNLYIQYPYF